MSSLTPYHGFGAFRGPPDAVVVKSFHHVGHYAARLCYSVEHLKILHAPVFFPETFLHENKTACQQGFSAVHNDRDIQQ